MSRSIAAKRPGYEALRRLDNQLIDYFQIAFNVRCDADFEDRLVQLLFAGLRDDAAISGHNS